MIPLGKSPKESNLIIVIVFGIVAITAILKGYDSIGLWTFLTALVGALGVIESVKIKIHISKK